MRVILPILAILLLVSASDAQPNPIPGMWNLYDSSGGMAASVIFLPPNGGTYLASDGAGNVYTGTYVGFNSVTQSWVYYDNGSQTTWSFYWSGNPAIGWIVSVTNPFQTGVTLTMR